MKILRKTLTTCACCGLFLGLGLWIASFFNLTYVPASLLSKIALDRGTLQLSWLAPVNTPQFRAEAREIMDAAGNAAPGTLRGRHETTGGNVESDLWFFQPGFRRGGYHLIETHWFPQYRAGADGLPIEGRLNLPLFLPLLLCGGMLVMLHYPIGRSRQLASIASFSVFVLCIVSWYASYWGVIWIPKASGPLIDLRRGSVELKLTPLGSAREGVATASAGQRTQGGGPARSNRLFTPRFRIGRYTGLNIEWLPKLYPKDPRLLLHILVPLWMPALLSAVVFFVSYAPLYRRRKWRKLGLCTSCGYDLRGSAERCPECGTRLAKGL